MNYLWVNNALCELEPNVNLGSSFLARHQQLIYPNQDIVYVPHEGVERFIQLNPGVRRRYAALFNPESNATWSFNPAAPPAPADWVVRPPAPPLRARANPQTPDAALNTALADLDERLSVVNIQYAVHGSCAALLRGARMREAPGDIDTLIADNRFLDAQNALDGNGPFTKDPGGSRLVAKFTHDNGTKVDLVAAGEFGMPIQNSSSVNGVRVLNLAEVMTSLLLRPETRQKEIESFASLLLNEDASQAGKLTHLEKQSVLQRVKPLMGVDNWDELLRRAKDIVRQLKLI